MQFNINKMNRESFLRWFFYTVVSKDKMGERFDRLTEMAHADQPMDMKIIISGHEFDDLQDTFDRADAHIEEQIEKGVNERSKEIALNLAKSERIAQILACNSLSELEDIQ